MNRRELLRFLPFLPLLPAALQKSATAPKEAVYRFAESARPLGAGMVERTRQIYEYVGTRAPKLVEDVRWVTERGIRGARGETVPHSTVYRVSSPQSIGLPRP